MKNFDITKEKVIIFLFSVVLTFFVSNNIAGINVILSYSLPITFGIILLLITGFLVFIAGLIVIRSLVEIAAGLSLIIFLAQSYCAHEVTQSLSGNHALAGLIFLGLSYVVYHFLLNVFYEFKKESKKIKEVEGRWEWRGVTLYTSLILFVILFITMVTEGGRDAFKLRMDQYGF